MPRSRALVGGLTLAIALPLAGCSLVRGTMRSYVVAPSGMEMGEARLRTALAAGQFGPMLERVTSRKAGAPDDELLRSLYRGTVAYYAGDYAASGDALRRAYDLTEDRFTKSASKAALSMLTNDRALPYVPGQNERLMVHYYGVQGYLRRGDLAGAAVEARRLSSLLERFESGQDAADASTRAVLRYLAGAVFEAAGDANDAAVAYRNARALAGEGIVPPRSSSAAGGAGEVVVVLEQGFVAHRVEQSLFVALGGDDVEAFADRDDGRKLGAADSLGARVLLQLAERQYGGVYDDGAGALRIVSAAGRLASGNRVGDNDYLLQVAWPVYRRSRDDGVRPAILVTGAARVPLRFTANVSDAAVGDYKRDRAKMLTRAIARAATKYALAELAEQQAGKKGDDDDDDDHAWLKQVVNAAGVVFERADLRSWHLLPGTLSVTRLSLPPGRHTLTVELPGAGGVTRRLPLADVDVRPGAITFVSHRVWDDRETGEEPAAVVGGRE